MATPERPETSVTNVVETCPPRSGLFPTTRWTLVLAAGATEGKFALAQLCEAYWYPVYGYIRGTGHSAENARDLAQGFFLHVLSGAFFERADRERGAFRAFLIHAIKFFLANEFDRERALKRGGGVECLPLNVADGERRFLREPSHTETPERIFQRRWAMAVVERAMERIREDFVRGGRVDHFEQLKPFLVNQAVVPYGDLAAALSVSESALKAGIHRIRKRYREALRAEVAATVASPEEVDAELRFLILALAGSQGETNG